MKKVLTAIGNSNLNNKIRNLADYEVLGEDIIQEEELLEHLKREEVVNVLFLCKDIVLHHNIEEFMNSIRKIHKNIFIVLFKAEDLKSNDKLHICNEKNVNLNNLEKYFNVINKVNTKQSKAKIISVSGAKGIGKSTFSTFLAKNVERNHKKVLLIDFALNENHIKTILRVEETLNYRNDIKNMVTKVSENFDVMCNLKLFFPDYDKINFFEIQKMFSGLKMEYDFIIIDTSSNLKEEYTKKILYNSDKIIFLVEPNILELKKAKDMLEIIEFDWKVPMKKMNIIINKSNRYEISKDIIQELFSDIETIGKIKYMQAYNLAINQDINQKEIYQEYEKIDKKILG